MLLSPDDKRNRFEKILQQIERLLDQPGSTEKRLQSICRMLREGIPYYHWVGFYRVDPEKDRELVLGPYEGEPTEHTRIPFGKGICGQAAEQGRTFVVPDVSKVDNYLSCSVRVRSEIVVPIVKAGGVVGELDVDSHDLAPFSSEDTEYLEKIARMISQRLF